VFKEVLERPRARGFQLGAEQSAQLTSGPSSQSGVVAEKRRFQPQTLTILSSKASQKPDEAEGRTIQFKGHWGGN
jgi:hypothetical protein